MAMSNCRHFTGYRPCRLNDSCNAHCPHLAVARPRILLVHLEALGAVVRATSVLPAIKRQYPHSHVTWVTKRPADDLLRGNPLIDRVLTISNEDLLVLSALEFDLALVIDKSLAAVGVLARTRAREVRGFVANAAGAIVPATPAAEELWHLGLDDQRKFLFNTKPETQLLIEALELGPYARDEYQIALTAAEIAEAQGRMERWRGRHELVIGLNTGCAGVIPYKKWTVAYQRELIAELHRNFSATVVLLGGPEDETRNQQIGSGLEVVQSPTNRGLRDGLVSVAACDVVISGDSLGMHMGIALKKWVVAWFGPTCAHEIDLYDRGVRLRAHVDCGPCWKRSCSRETMCYDRVPIAEVVEAVARGREWKMSSSKPHFLVTWSSASL